MKIKSLAPVLFAVALSLTLATQDADAKRIGGGTSIGRQSQSLGKGTATTAPTAPVKAPTAAPSPVQPTPPVTAPSTARRWLGPLAGLAAGLGIAALLSHFGMGGAMAEMMGSMLLIGAVLLGAMLLWRMWRNRGANADSSTNLSKPAFAGAPGMFDAKPQDKLQEEAAQRAFDAPPASGGPALPTWTIPADMDPEAFTRTAKVDFLRLQAASDNANLADIREFTTPEMFAEIQLQISERGPEPQQTEVFKLETQLLGVEEIEGRQLASVRFSGTIREEPGAYAERFSEVWNFAKTPDGRWLVAGIQQTH